MYCLFKSTLFQTANCEFARPGQACKATQPIPHQDGGSVISHRPGRIHSCPNSDCYVVDSRKCMPCTESPHGVHFTNYKPFSFSACRSQPWRLHIPPAVDQDSSQRVDCTEQQAQNMKLRLRLTGAAQATPAHHAGPASGRQPGILKAGLTPAPALPTSHTSPAARAATTAAVQTHPAPSAGWTLLMSHCTSCRHTSATNQLAHDSRGHREGTTH